jgi:hypothetical protein
MHNRASDVEIFKRLSIIQSDIIQLKSSNILQTIPDIPELESPSQRRNGREAIGLDGPDNVLENTISSVENFVDDSVSTVYARSTTCSEASWSRSGDAFDAEFLEIGKGCRVRSNDSRIEAPPSRIEADSLENNLTAIRRRKEPTSDLAETTKVESSPTRSTEPYIERQAGMLHCRETL